MGALVATSKWQNGIVLPLHLLGDQAANWWYRTWRLVHLFNFVERGSGEVSWDWPYQVGSKDSCDAKLNPVGPYSLDIGSAMVGETLTIGNPLAELLGRK